MKVDILGNKSMNKHGRTYQMEYTERREKTIPSGSGLFNQRAKLEIAQIRMSLRKGITLKGEQE